MILKITDIPAGGRDLEFTLDIDSLNQRIESAREGTENGPSKMPHYVFSDPAKVELHLNLEGSTVFVKGKASGQYSSLCARCAEETETGLQVPINMVLKPRLERGPIESLDEDVSFGFYREQVVDCSDFSEELLILSLPFTVLCSDSCKGLCASCGENLNHQMCGCIQEPEGDPRFAVLKGLKLT